MPHDVPQPEVRQLLAEIEAAFGDVRLGDGISLHQARALDDYETDEVVAAARALDAVARWQDITDDKLDRLNDTLAFMDAAGFRYHLPRFMTWSLTHAGTGTGSFAIDAPVYACDFRNNLKEYAMSRYALLSPEQLRTVARFLRFAAAHDGPFDGRVAARALKRFWGQYG